jgi:hypothetical protein
MVGVVGQAASLLICCLTELLKLNEFKAYTGKYGWPIGMVKSGYGLFDCRILELCPLVRLYLYNKTGTNV